MDQKKLDALQKTINAKIHAGTGEYGLDGLLMDCSTAIQHLREQVLAQAKEIERKDKALREAVDLLTERKQGGHARSPNHNARLVLDAALSPAAQEG